MPSTANLNSSPTDAPRCNFLEFARLNICVSDPAALRINLVVLYLLPVFMLFELTHWSKFRTLLVSLDSVLRIYETHNFSFG